MSAPTAVAPFSIEALGRRLSVMRQQGNALDTLRHQLGQEIAHGPMTPHRLMQRNCCEASAGVQGHCYALSDLIVESRADTLADALVQVLVIIPRLDSFTMKEGVEQACEQSRLERALSRVARLLSQASGVPLTELAGLAYASQDKDPWPDIDVSGVMDPHLALQVTA